MATPRPPAGKRAALFVAAAAMFWFFGPLSGDPSPVEDPLEGPLRLLILGDDQLLRDDGRPGWPIVTRNVLSGALERPVEVSVDGVGTAGELTAYLRTLSEPVPDVILVSLGWEDGAPGEAVPDPDAKGKLGMLAAARVVAGREGFFLRTQGPTRISSASFLSELREAKEMAAARDVRLVFVEQTARVLNGPVDIAPTTGARPGPWIAVVTKLDEQSRAEWWSEADPLRLTDAGHRRIGGVIGEQLAEILRP